jgi:hypothetical protein
MRDFPQGTANSGEQNGQMRTIGESIWAHHGNKLVGGEHTLRTGELKTFVRAPDAWPGPEILLLGFRAPSPA